MYSLIELIDIINNYYYNNDKKYIQQSINYNDITNNDIIKQNKEEINYYINELLNNKFELKFKLNNILYYSVNLNEDKKVLLIINTSPTNNINRKLRYLFNSNLNINYFFLIGIMNLNLNIQTKKYNNFIKNLNIKDISKIEVDIVENFFKFDLLNNIIDSIKLSEFLLLVLFINYIFIKLNQEFSQISISNLTPNNILILYLNEPINLKFKINNKVIKLKTKILIKLVDFSQINILNNKKIDTNNDFNTFIKSLNINNNEKKNIIDSLLNINHINDKIIYIIKYIKNKISSNSIDMSEESYSQNSTFNIENTETLSNLTGGNLNSSTNDVFASDYAITNNNSNISNSENISKLDNLSLTSEFNNVQLTGAGNKKLNRTTSIRYLKNPGDDLIASASASDSIRSDKHSKKQSKSSKSGSSIATFLDVDKNEMGSNRPPPQTANNLRQNSYIPPHGASNMPNSMSGMPMNHMPPQNHMHQGIMHNTGHMPPQAVGGLPQQIMQHPQLSPTMQQGMPHKSAYTITPQQQYGGNDEQNPEKQDFFF
jgi:hypothetical protein